MREKRSETQRDQIALQATRKNLIAPLATWDKFGSGLHQKKFQKRDQIALQVTRKNLIAPLASREFITVNLTVLAGFYAGFLNLQRVGRR